jgi:hypothetical protein
MVTKYNKDKNDDYLWQNFIASQKKKFNNEII